MIYEVIDPNGVGYSDELNRAILVEFGEIIPNEAIENKLFKQEGLDYLVKNGRLQIRNENEFIAEKVEQVSNNFEDIETLKKTELLKLASELNLGVNRDLSLLSKNKIKEIIYSSIKPKNKKLIVESVR